MRQHSICVAIAAALSSIAGAQTAGQFSPSNPTRSGLVRLYGSNLGDGGSDRLFLVQINGSRNSARAIYNAHIASWRQDLIEFYVPEQTTLGVAGVYLQNATGNHYLGALDVRERTSGAGRLKWRFQAADQYIITRPAIGPDGTVYAIGNFGHLYALSPDGGLKWVWSKGADGTVDVGANGTVYCAGGGGVQAFAPNGTRIWQHDLNSVILAGPSVGPDGNIYAADNARWNPTNSTGAIVLSPSGQEIWSGGVFFERGGSHQTEVQFDANRAYIWSFGDSNSGAVGGLQSIKLGGGLDWNNPNTVGLQPSGLASGGVIAHGTSTTQRMSTSGSLMWSFDLWSIGGSQPHGDVVSAPDGGAYFLTSNTRLNGIRSNGSLKFSNVLGGIVGQLTRTPDNSKLFLQRAVNFGTPSRIEAYSGTNGSFLWASEDLPLENGMYISVYNRMKFSADGSTLVFGTVGPYTSATEAHCYVYSMDAR